jgi:hypothetical protein
MLGRFRHIWHASFSISMIGVSHTVSAALTGLSRFHYHYSSNESKRWCCSQLLRSFPVFGANAEVKTHKPRAKHLSLYVLLNLVRSTSLEHMFVHSSMLMHKLISSSQSLLKCCICILITVQIICSLHRNELLF